MRIIKISKITKQDSELIFEGLNSLDKSRLKGSKILVTGFAGSLGYSLLHFLAIYGNQLGVLKVYGIDNYIFGRPKWIEEISKNPLFDLRQLDIITCDLEFAKDADFIFHMASLASPVYYRKYPLETIDADVTGLRRLLDFYKDTYIKGFLFYSSSEIDGDPDSSNIPTKETYWGNVNPCGPRSCYDESKRFGETLCYNFAKLYNMPITIVRPFNNYGPGMRVDDQRVVADFAKAVINQQDIVIYSDGRPTRTFDYIPNSTIGYIKCALFGKFEVFNIGSDNDEISVSQLAELYKRVGNEIFGYNGGIVYQTHSDKDYLIDNPNRRCPDLTKARKFIDYKTQINIEEGIRRYLVHLNIYERENLE